MTAWTLTAVIHQEDGWYVADCPEVGTVSQGRTPEEALVNLREATELFLEEADLPQIRTSTIKQFQVHA